MRTQQFVALIQKCNSHALPPLYTRMQFSTSGRIFPGERDGCDKLMRPSKLTIPTKLTIIPTAYNPKIQQYQHTRAHKTHKIECTQQYHWYYTNNNQNPSTFQSLTPLWRLWTWQSVERFLSVRTFVRMACPCPCDQIWCHSCRWEILNLPFDANSCLQINNQHRQWCFLQQERKCDIWNYFSISILCLSLSFINATASQEPGYNRQTQVCLH